MPCFSLSVKWNWLTGLDCKCVLILLLTWNVNTGKCTTSWEHVLCCMLYGNFLVFVCSMVTTTFFTFSPIWTCSTVIHTSIMNIVQVTAFVWKHFLHSEESPSNRYSACSSGRHSFENSVSSSSNPPSIGRSVSCTSTSTRTSSVYGWFSSSATHCWMQHQHFCTGFWLHKADKTLARSENEFVVIRNVHCFIQWK